MYVHCMYMYMYACTVIREFRRYRFLPVKNVGLRCSFEVAYCAAVKSLNRWWIKL